MKAADAANAARRTLSEATNEFNRGDMQAGARLLNSGIAQVSAIIRAGDADPAGRVSAQDKLRDALVGLKKAAKRAAYLAQRDTGSFLFNDSSYGRLVDEMIDALGGYSMSAKGQTMRSMKSTNDMRRYLGSLVTYGRGQISAEDAWSYLDYLKVALRKADSSQPWFAEFSQRLPRLESYVRGGQGYKRQVAIDARYLIGLLDKGNAARRTKARKSVRENMRTDLQRVERTVHRAYLLLSKAKQMGEGAGEPAIDLCVQASELLRDALRTAKASKPTPSSGTLSMHYDDFLRELAMAFRHSSARGIDMTGDDFNPTLALRRLDNARKYLGVLRNYVAMYVKSANGHTGAKTVRSAKAAASPYAVIAAAASDLRFLVRRSHWSRVGGVDDDKESKAVALMLRAVDDPSVNPYLRKLVVVLAKHMQDQDWHAGRLERVTHEIQTAALTLGAQRNL